MINLTCVNQKSPGEDGVLRGGRERFLDIELKKK